MTVALTDDLAGIVTRPDAVRRIKHPLKLDLGGAAVPYANDEYTTVDLYGDMDIEADVRDLPFADNSVQAIWASHVMEHLAIADVPKALAEWHRVLAPRRRAIIRVPNFDYVARYWLTGPDRGWAEAMVFGLQTDDGEYHKSAFTAAILRADLEAAGFEVLRVEMRWTHNQETLQAVARKPGETSA
jgi:predicted SAM-dependent methyltransferase